MGAKRPTESYRVFLEMTRESLREVVGMLENSEFHHADAGSDRIGAYQRVAAVLENLDERVNWYDHVKAPRR